MKKPSTQLHSGDPIGIVISRGTREEPIPTCAAYVWGPAPDGVSEASKAA